jgi:hypothetical protein
LGDFAQSIGFGLLPKQKPYKPPILCLDFDGVIHSYSSGWKGARNIPDPPVDGVGAFLLEALLHFRVAILSSRSHQWGGRRAMKSYVRQILWDACLADSDATARAWEYTQGKPASWIPWTAYDVRDVADHIGRKVMWPLFKPPAVLTIDDRALTFSGNWTDYRPQDLKRFQPWNKRSSNSQSNGATADASHSVRPIRPTPTGLT